MKTNYIKLFSLLSISFWLLAFALLPFLMVLAASFLQHDEQQIFLWIPTLDNFKEILNPIYLTIFFRSFTIAAVTTLICLALAFPFTYIISRLKTPHKSLFLLLVIIPLWTNSLIRSYAMIAILKAKGVVNNALLSLGIIDTPLQMLFTNTAVIIGLVYNLLPFMILPLYANLEKLDQRLIDAARDLGANSYRIFVKIILPLSTNGIIAGCTLVFLPAMTLFYIPNILGGAKSMLVGNLIQQQFLIEQNWPLGAATNVMLTGLVLLFIFIYWRSQKESKQVII